MVKIRITVGITVDIAKIVGAISMVIYALAKLIPLL